jgi:hypothetical protein
MKKIAITSLIALALTTAAGCRQHMGGMMHGSMMQGMGGSSEKSDSSGSGMMMGNMGGKGMMTYCTEQCPMMKGKS